MTTSPHINHAGGQKVWILLYPSKSEHPDDNLTDFIEIYGASIVGIESHENPIQLLFYGGHVLDICGLIPLKEVQRPTLVLIKDPEQSFIENIFLADRRYILSSTYMSSCCYIFTLVELT